MYNCLNMVGTTLKFPSAYHRFAAAKRLKSSSVEYITILEFMGLFIPLSCRRKRTGFNPPVVANPSWITNWASVVGFAGKVFLRARDIACVHAPLVPIRALTSSSVCSKMPVCMADGAAIVVAAWDFISSLVLAVSIRPWSGRWLCPVVSFGLPFGMSVISAPRQWRDFFWSHTHRILADF